MTLYVGTAGWSYPGGQGRWDGVFYPDSIADRDKLTYYSQFFNAVEINSSFYRPPAASAARGWAQRVPEQFRFTAKLWQKFTHPKMFEEATGRPAFVRSEDFDIFTAGLQPLQSSGKLGALLAQFPPSFKPDDGTLEYLTDLVRRIRGEGFNLAVELRHAGWSDGKQIANSVRELFEEERVAWVMIDEPKFRTSIGEVPLTSELGYFRFHGRNYQQWWHHEAAEDRYNYLYTPAEQRELDEQVDEVVNQTSSTYVFYNNHYRAKAVVNALELQAAHGIATRSTVPDALVREYPELRSVVSKADDESLDGRVKVAVATETRSGHHKGGHTP